MGGKQERLVPESDRKATNDPVVAGGLVRESVKELTEKRKNRELGIAVPNDPATLGAFATEHLKAKKRDGDGTDAWLKQSEHHIRAACAFFKQDRELSSLTTGDMDRWVAHLRKQPSRKGGTLSDSTVRKHLNSMSNLLKRAIANTEETGVSRNVVRDMFSKPTPQPKEAAYLEAQDAALLLGSARTYRADAEQGAFQYMHALLATFLLTGGRRSEVLGLLVDDVSLKLNKVYFRPNAYRRLKTTGSIRTVPLWPQLREILGAYFAQREQAGGLGTLLFPATVREKKREKSDEKVPETMLVDLRKPLDRIAGRAGFPEDAPMRLHQLRHTYTAARLQTCDRGRPIAPFTVARELGHSSTAMIEKVYGHLHDRAQDGGVEVVEYRVEHHREKLGERLEALALDAG